MANEACCLPGGACWDVPPGDCVALYGGVPLGPDTVCSPGICDDVEACCYRNNDCQNRLFADCIEHGGLPMGRGSMCGTAADYCSKQACCYQEYVGGEWLCANGTPDECKGPPTYGTPLGRGIRCEVIADVGCKPAGVPELCCLRDGLTQLSDVLPAHCLAAGGTIGTCPEGPVEEECRRPEPDVEVGPIWSLRTCQTVPLIPVMVPQGVPGHRAGTAILKTARGVRHRPENRCDEVLAPMTVNPAGYDEPVFCSNQQWTDGEQLHEGTMAVQPNGYGVALSAYAAPDWSETILGSALLRYGGPLV